MGQLTVLIRHAQDALLAKVWVVVVERNLHVRKEAALHRHLQVINECTTQLHCLFYPFVRYRIGVGN